MAFKKITKKEWDEVHNYNSDLCSHAEGDLEILFPPQIQLIRIQYLNDE